MEQTIIPTTVGSHGKEKKKKTFNFSTITNQSLYEMRSFTVKKIDAYAINTVESNQPKDNDTKIRCKAQAAQKQKARLNIVCYQRTSLEE